MNSEYLRTFIMLAELGSYTKTAQKMIVVPSTVSKQIKFLENELGRELVIRDKKNVKLTGEGKLFLEYARKVVSIEDSFLHDLNIVTDFTVNLRIGAVPSLLQGRVMPFLSWYIGNHPKCRCNVISDHSQILLNRLYDGDIDICFSYRTFHENNCECGLFSNDEMILVTAEDTPYENGITVEQLKNLHLVKESQLSVADSVLYHHVFDDATNVILAASTGNYIIPFLKSGIGYGFVVKKYVQNDIASGVLKEIPILDHERIMLPSYFIYKKVNTVVTDHLLCHLKEYLCR